MTESPKPVPGTRGFTLVELLVLVAIIGVLIGIALPLLGRGRRAAQTTASISNLRQVHILLMNYVNENNYVFPSALGGDRSGTDPGRYWRRTIWEASYGEFPGDSGAAVAAMQASDYAKVMWCPMMVAEHGQDQHPSGRGSYAINFFFIDGTWRVGDEYRRLIREDMIGKKEPLLMAGTLLDSNPEFGTWEAIQSSKFPYDTAWMNLHYAYGAGGNQAIGVFLDGHAESISREEGIALDPLLRDPTNFE